MKDRYSRDGRVEFRAVVRRELQDARVAGASHLSNRVLAGRKAMGAYLDCLVEGDHNFVTDRPLAKRSVINNEAESRRQKKCLVPHISSPNGYQVLYVVDPFTSLDPYDRVVVSKKHYLFPLSFAFEFQKFMTGQNSIFERAIATWTSGVIHPFYGRSLTLSRSGVMTDAQDLPLSREVV